MERTSKLHRNLSLSLGNKIHKRSHNASTAQKRTASVQNKQIDGEQIQSTTLETLQIDGQHSPSVKSVSSECSTPPNRRSLNLDDSLDYSPTLMDTSLSPTCYFSQTMMGESKDVNWCWSNKPRYTDKPINDSGFNSEELDSCKREARMQERLDYEKRRQEKRRQQEREYRRAQQMRLHEMLIERYEKMTENLKAKVIKEDGTVAQIRNLNAETKSVETAKPNSSTVTQSCAATQKKQVPKMSDSLEDFFNDMNDFIDLKTPSKVKGETKQLVAKENADALEDFFNDSDTDGFLLAASQQMESEIVTFTQKTIKEAPVATEITTTTTTTATTMPISATNKSIITSTMATTPTTSKKDKRSSYYMKFLEEETLDDDWFAALDEAVLQAAQSKKARTSLQRYKSMPNSTTANKQILTSAIVTKRLTSMPINSNHITESTALPSGNRTNSSNHNNNSSSNHSRIKRHASTHALNPLTRDKQLAYRKHY